jgi:hypothetical protein
MILLCLVFRVAIQFINESTEGQEPVMLLDRIHHLAVISKDIDKLRVFYTGVFEAEVGPTEPHGDEGDETMTRREKCSSQETRVARREK